MGKPIAGRNKFPYGVNGIVVDGAVLSDGTKLTNIRISKQRSINRFDLMSADGLTLYKFVKITGVDANGVLLNPSDQISDILDSLEPGHFIISMVNGGTTSVGFAVRLMSNKVTLQDGSTLFIDGYQGQTIPIIPVTGVTVSPSTATFNYGQTQQLTATVAPANATNKSIVWSSSSSLIPVSSTGLVSALDSGTAIITATTADGSFTSSSTITVNAVYVSSVTPNPATVAVGLTEPLILTVSKNGEGYPYEAQWVSSDTDIVTVDSSGVITGVAAGTATVTVSESPNWSVVVNITVTA